MMDKRILSRLLGNCRESFRTLARDFAVSCPTIIARVNRLRQWGVLQRYTAEFSHEMLGVQWFMAELQINGSASQIDLFKEGRFRPA